MLSTGKEEVRKFPGEGTGRKNPIHLLASVAGLRGRSMGVGRRDKGGDKRLLCGRTSELEGGLAGIASSHSAEEENKTWRGR